jgi:RHS repeat-associated protein
MQPENTFGAVYASLVRQTGRPDVKTYLDSLGRTVRTETTNPSGLVFTESRYNAKGQLAWTSVPHFVHESETRANRTAFTYDFAGRKISESYLYDYSTIDPTEEDLGDEFPPFLAPGYNPNVVQGFYTYKSLTTTYDYDYLTTTVINPAGYESSKTYNAAGDLILATDEGGTIDYYYRWPGYVKEIVAPGGAETTITYDDYGRQETITDPNAGTIEYVYDAFDRIVWQEDAKGNLTENSYDEFGRLEQVIETDTETNLQRTTTRSYVGQSAGKPNPNVGRLYSTFCGKGDEQIYTYDRFGRVTELTNKIGGDSYTTSYSYDKFGNLKTYTYPSGYELTYTYDDNGFQVAIFETQTEAVVWQLMEVNAMGQELESTAVGHQKTQIYNAFGQPTHMYLVGLMEYEYQYNESTGNMTYRYNSFNGTQSFFFYDELNRLTSGVGYKASGNIANKDDVGNYAYESDKPHAVTEVSKLNRPEFNHDITYTSFGKIESIKRIDEYEQETFPKLFFTYGPTHQRSEVNLFFDDGTHIRRRYLPNMEITEFLGGKGNTESQHTKEYIHSPYGLVAIYYGSDLDPDSEFDPLDPLDPILPDNPGLTGISAHLYAVATDHLGSIVAEWNPRKESGATPVGGSPQMGAYEFFGYDAWGRRYLYDNGNGNGPPHYDYFDDRVPFTVYLSPEEILDFFARGYTGHEHLDMFGLINMNGRMYDPVIARFLSPDPYVPDATYTQDFNRYTYARNNPLSYTDPTGELVWLIPSIGWSNDGGLNIGLNFIVGLPGIFSVQTGVGYNFKSDDAYTYVGATAAFATAYVSASTASGVSVGLTFGLSPFMGFPVSTNFLSAGVNYNFENEVLSGQFSAWTLSEGGNWNFNPSVSAMIYPEHTTNWARGKGFRSNSGVFNRMMAGDYTCQQILDYFGFKGTYDPRRADIGGVNAAGDIFYGDGAFQGNFDRLALVARHEMRHSRNARSGKYDGIDLDNDIVVRGLEEWSTYLYSYRNQGLYRNHDLPGKSLAERIQYYGTQGGVYYIGIGAPSHAFSSQRWHFIYRIPRKW